MGFVAVSINTISVLCDDIRFNCRIRDECMRVSSSNSGDKIKFTFGFIYTLEELKYLDVSPEDVVWISPDEAIVYFVSSNTDWKVE